MLARLRAIARRLRDRDALLTERGDLLARGRELGVEPAKLAEAADETIPNVRQILHRRRPRP